MRLGPHPTQIISSNAFRTNPDITMRSAVYSTISRLSRGIQYIPLSYWIDSETITLPSEPQTSGTCAQVYRVTQESGALAVKVLRTSIEESPTELKKVGAVGGKYNTWTWADAMRNSVFVGR